MPRLRVHGRKRFKLNRLNMKTTVTKYAFLELFRALRPTNFSREGLEALFEHLESIEDETGTELELDVIGLCGDFAEDTAEDIAQSYGIEPKDGEELSDTVQAWLENEGALVSVLSSGSFVYRTI